MGDRIEIMGLMSRGIRAADLDLIAEWEADPDTRPWLGDTGRSWHERAIGDPTQFPMFTTDGVEPVGFTVFGRMDDDEVELRRMVVVPQRRGLGLGRRLLQAMLIFALDAHGSDAVWLDVKRDNVRARDLYESEGFEVIRSLGDEHPNADGTSSDLVHMSCRTTQLRR
jgi:ribosomal protein S18 acetylase RimI-like enzyme